MSETMLTYIKEEPAVLIKILENFDFNSLKNALPNKIRRILILATGSSLNAALCTKYYMEQIGKVLVTIEEPFNFEHYGTFDTEIDIIIAISQGGTSTSTINSIDKLQQYNKPIIVITNNKFSLLNRQASYSLDLNIGEENVGYVTKGFSGTVLNLQLLSLAISLKKNTITKGEYDQNIAYIKLLINKIPSLIEKSISYFENNKSYFLSSSRFSCIGYGSEFGIAKEFETKFTEVVRMPSSGFELEAYMHGPYLEAQTNHCLIFLTNSDDNYDRNKNLAEYMAKYVRNIIIISQNKIDFDLSNFSLEVPNINNHLLPIVSAIPIQIWAYMTATSKNIDLSVDTFPDFDQILKSKIIQEEI